MLQLSQYLNCDPTFCHRRDKAHCTSISCIVPHLPFTLLYYWQRKPEGSSMTRNTLYTNRAVMPFNDRATDIQPESKANTRSTLHLNTFHLMETLPDTLLLLHRNTWSFITHSHSCNLILNRHSHPHGTDLRRIFQGIRQIIRQYLPNTVGIYQHWHMFLM